MWHEVDRKAVAQEENAALPPLWPEQVEEAIAMARLHLYNHGLPCGAAAVRRYLHDELHLRSLPSTRRIGRILTLYGLTYARTGWHGESTAEDLPAGVPRSAWVPPAQRRYLSSGTRPQAGAIDQEGQETQ